MPVFLEQKLRASSRRRGLTGKAAERYVYGAMNNMGAMRGSRETAKGRSMEAKHERKVAHRGGTNTANPADRRK